MNRLRSSIFASLLFSVLLFHAVHTRAAEPTPKPDGTATATTADTNAAAEATLLLRQLQSQMDVNQRTIDVLREQAIAARHNEEVTAARLKLIEMTLTERHARELSALQASNRLTLTIVGVVAAVGLLGMIALAIFLLRATTKLAELPAALARNRALGAGGDPRGLLTGSTSGEASAQLLNVVALLEQKFHALENSLEHRPATTSIQPSTVTTPATGSPTAANGDRVVQLLNRGQNLLDQEKAEEALATFDEAAGLDSNNTEPLVRRGKALEKLGRMEDALKAYDRALALDDNLTIAYLGKGGVFNRLERFGEALECYERALRTQSKATTEAAKG